MPKTRQTTRHGSTTSQNGTESESDGDTDVSVVEPVGNSADVMANIASSMVALQKLVEEVKRQGDETNNKITALRVQQDQTNNEINVVRDQLNVKISKLMLNPSLPSAQSTDKTEQIARDMPTTSSFPNISLSNVFEQSSSKHLPTSVVDVSRTSHSYNLYPLPDFDGKLEEWPLFYASYLDTTAEFSYNNKQNLIRLNKALHGNARDAVVSLLIYPDDVSAVIEELQFNFGRPELLVRSQQEKITRMAAIPENRLDAILLLSNQVRNMVALFKSSNCSHHLLNSTLLDQLISKLPPSKQFAWAEYVTSLVTVPTIETFSLWVSKLTRVVSIMSSNAAVVPRFSQQPLSQQRLSQVTRRVLHSNDVNPEAVGFVCPVCQGSHGITNCPLFAARSIDEKWKFVKENRLCFGCLKKGHSLVDCQAKETCNIDDCKRKHNRLLHSDNTSSPPISKLNPDAHVFSCRPNCRTNQLFKIVPVIISGPLGSLSVYAMFDEGSSISLLENHVAVALGLKGQSMTITLQWYGDETKTERVRKTVAEIKGAFNGAKPHNLSNIYAVSELNLPRQSFHAEKFAHFNTIPVASYQDAKPVILLGLDNAFLGLHDDVAEAGTQQPIAIKTKLGWVAFGPSNSTASRVPTVMHIRESQTMHDINKLVEEYFSIENFGVRSSDVVLESDDNRRAREILETTTKRCQQRFETGLLWRKDDVKLPSSYEMAKKRLLKIERRMSADPSYAKCYKSEIAKYIEKGYAKLLSSPETNIINPVVWYLPHFGVVNPNKPDKLRIVFDAAATTNNVSLNASLLKGPEHAKPLIDVLYKFRQGAVAIAGDIQEMFSQIRIRVADQNAQRFLWRDGNEDQPIRTYVMTSMIFGATCSPCCAEFVKNRNASEFKNLMPKGAAAVIEKTYVDDFVCSFVDEREAEEVTLEAVEINAQAGFNLRGFVSNCKELQTKLNGSQPVNNKTIAMERQTQADKVLGLFWNVETDTLEFHFQFHKVPRQVLDVERPPTKREMLGVVMSIYDPFGLLANYTIFSKLLIQATWKRQIQWDEPLPHELLVQWNNWWREFQKVREFSVARCYSPLLSAADEVQLHIFVDASSSAYATVTYIRVKKKDDINVALVAAKSRCGPPKGMTVPRLELQAAVLGGRLSESIRQCLEYKIDDIIFWSDSKTVVSWIRSTTREYKQFVACRIAEILTVSANKQWRWLPTRLNVADEATRAKLPNQYSKWISGPDFLHQDEEFWPQETCEIESEHCGDEEIVRRILLLESSFPLKYENYSSYHKMLRSIAWIRRFVANCRLPKARRQKGELSVTEITQAEIAICRQIQMEEFAHDFAHLRRSGRVARDSSLRKLTPFIAEGDVLRVNGRIDAAYCLPLTARQPIILPKVHHVTHLIVASHHHKRHHQNDHLVINEIRQRFWIPNLRSVLKSVKRRCPSCIVSRAQPSVPLMGQLPPDRVTPYVRPFSYTGVDYCGPFFVAIGRRREKRWVALFTCLTTRAVHLEVTDELSTDAFLLCLRNFMNRRGTPIRMRSDNGTNFVGAQKELVPENRLFDPVEIQRNLAKDNIEWIFNCPANPNAGGCWERLVQCVKRLLARTLKSEAPRLETFRSVIIEAENIINSRPLTDLQVSSEDEEPLTPNHFLLGCLNSTQTPTQDEENVCLRKQWKIAQNLKDRIWKRWIAEYLPQLLRRPKWTERVEPLKPGQLVIVCDPNMPRSQWTKGIVTEIHTAKDGQVRTAEVRTSRGTLRRPASKLAALVFDLNPHAQ